MGRTSRAAFSAVAEQKLLAADATAGQSFADSVAVSGDTVVIGATGDSTGGASAGAVYVFERSTGVWLQQAKLTLSDAQAGDILGRDVAVSGDTLAAIGRGAVYVFVRAGSVWSEQQVLAGSTGEDCTTVAIDGDTIVCGAPLVAYVFVRNAGTWTEQTTLLGSDAAPGDGYASAVAISGETAVVGANFQGSGGFNPGAAYVFVRDGTNWSEQAKLIASNGLHQDEFGRAVAIDGDVVVVGSPRSRSGDSGSAYMFERSGTTWDEVANVIANDFSSGAEFGTAVAVSGGAAVVGTELGGPSSAGAAYVFVRSIAGWVGQQQILAWAPVGQHNFGRAVGVSGDTALVGASFDDAGGASAGAAYTFRVGRDVDVDGIPDVVDNCAFVANPAQVDDDADGVGNPCDLDGDGDGIPDAVDNCVATANGLQSDVDGDGQGDACDPDIDDDGHANAADNCPLVANPGQEDADTDDIGDVCDGDRDGDEVADATDNCPGVANADQADADADGLGDVCDADADGDGVPDLADNCVGVSNPMQADTDRDTSGDACDDDDDGDGVNDAADNCPLVANADQTDTDGDGTGDACVDDIDGDGVPDATDNCVQLTNSSQADRDDDGLGDACDPVDNSQDGCAVANSSTGQTGWLFLVLAIAAALRRRRR